MKNGELVSAPATAEVVELIERAPQVPAQQPVNPIVLAHTLLRGRYHWAITLALIGAVIGALVGYFALPPTYRSTGVIRVKPVLPKIIYETDEKSMMPRFDGFVDSQVQFVKSQRVIDLAMQDENWKKFGRGLSNESIAEFQESLQVARPKNSELIVVTFEDREPSAASAAVTAVMKAYIDLYGNKDSEEGAKRLEELERRRNDLDTQVVYKNGAITSHAKEFGSDGEALKRTYDYKVDELNKLESQLLEAELAVAWGEARADADDKQGEQPTGDQDLLLLGDENMFRLKRDRNAAVREMEILSSRFGSAHPEMVRAQARLNNIEQEIADRTAWLKQRGALNPPRNGILAGANQDIGQLRAALQRITALHQKVRTETIELGRKNLLIEGLKAELEVLKSRLKEVDNLIDALQFERRNVAGRIEIASEGDRPVAPYKDRRRALAAVGAIALAGLGVGCILLVGVSDRRLHRVADANAQFQQDSKVLGIVPEIEDQAIDFGSATVAAHCVHQIRAMLQMRPGRSTFAITSPAAGDGKTTLAIALGMSFAASATRTLLIDLDLIGGGLTARVNRVAHRKLGQILLRSGGLTQRQLDETLKLARGQGKRLGEVLVELGVVTAEQLEQALLAQLRTSVGLSNVLAGERLVDCVAPAGIPNLFILPLGAAGREQVSQLCPELIARIIAEAQKDFATVLIDTGPILGSLEAAMLAGSDAGVILTVSRGGNKGLARRAIQFLTNARVRLEGVVFNRAEDGDLQSSGYSSYASRVSQSVHVMRSSRPQLRHVVNSTVEASANWSRGSQSE